MSKIRKIDAAKLVSNYRKAVAKRETVKTRNERTECTKAIAQLRREWHKWQGEDSLHEMAFGEPAED